MDEPKNVQNQLNIDVPEEIAGGVYSNFVIVGHSPTEFVLDFVQVLPGLPKAKVRSRIIMTPQHAKRLLNAMKENIEKFEAAFGTVTLNEQKLPPYSPGFGGPAGIA